MRLISTAKQEGRSLTLGINLSGQTLSEEGFLDYVTDLIRQYRLDPRRFCFEITETAAISNLSRVVHFMQALKKGEIFEGPRSLYTSCCSSNDRKPPIPLPMMTPVRSGS